MSHTKLHEDNPATSGVATDAMSDQAIAERAYALYLARGSMDGFDLQDWLQAERELREEASAGSKQVA